MKQLFVILAVSLAALAGCSTTHNVQRDAAAEWVLEASKQLVGNSVTVTDRTGRLHKGRVVSLDERGMQLLDQSAGTAESLRLDTIVYINSGSNAGIVAVGTVAGMLGGGIIGAAILSTDEHVASSGMFPHGLGSTKATLGGAIGAAVGGILGAVTLGEASRTHHYIFTDTVMARENSAKEE